MHLSKSTRHEHFLRGQTSIPDAKPFPLAIDLLREIIKTDFSLFNGLLHKCESFALIDEKPFTSFADYEQIPDKTFETITAVLSATCTYFEPTEDSWAEKMTVQTLCQLLVSLGYATVRRGIELPPTTPQIGVSPSGDRVIPDEYPQETLPLIQLINRMARLPEPLFNLAIANMAYKQCLLEEHISINPEDGYEAESALLLVKCWGVAHKKATLAGMLEVKDAQTKDNCIQLIQENNEIGSQVSEWIIDNLNTERSLLFAS